MSPKRTSFSLRSPWWWCAIGAAAGACLVSSAGGCQILSGISDLEATGGANAGSSSSSTTAATTATTAASTTGSMGTGICDPQAGGQQDCLMCGTSAMGGFDGPKPPYCDADSPAGECVLDTCTGTMASTESVCSQSPGKTEVDTTIGPMRVVCRNANCDGDTIDCLGHDDKTGVNKFSCTVDCQAGACNSNTVVDCRGVYGVCTVNCFGDSCAGLTLYCGANECDIQCEVEPAMPPQIEIDMDEKPCAMPLPDPDCKAQLPMMP